MVIDRAINAPRDAAEPPEIGDDGKGDEGKDDRLRALCEAPGRKDKVVDHVRGHKDGKVERRELVAAQGK